MPDSLGGNYKNEYGGRAKTPLTAAQKAPPDTGYQNYVRGSSQSRQPQTGAFGQTSQLRQPHIGTTGQTSQLGQPHTGTINQASQLRHLQTGAFSQPTQLRQPQTSWQNQPRTGQYQTAGQAYRQPPVTSARANTGMRNSSMIRPIQPTTRTETPSASNGRRQSGYVQPVTIRGSAAKPTRLEGVSLGRHIGNSSKPPKKKRDFTALKDFCLGLIIGFAVFGTAAYFVVNAVISMFDML